MKYLIVILFFCIFFTGCKKDIPDPDVVRMNIYSTRIKNTNYNESNKLYWYIRKANKGGYFYMVTTRDVKDFTNYMFNYTLKLPADLMGKLAENEIVVWVSQLNGDMLSDINGKDNSKQANNKGF